MLDPDSGFERHAMTVGTPINDTVRMPWESAREPVEKVVPPALAVLFRVAVGPGADYYVPRFLRYEKAGRTFPSWNWPALLLPSAWAFYRRLWGAAFAFALMPILGAAVFVGIESAIGDSTAAWLGCAAFLVWILPGVIAALLANSLVYARVKRLVRQAGALGSEMSVVARSLAARRPTAIVIAILFVAVAIALAPRLIAPGLYAMYQDRTVRAQVIASLAAVRPLQRQIEQSWQRFNLIPHTLDDAAMLVGRDSLLLDNVSFSPITGRFRLALGPTIEELSGKAIFLAPALGPSRQMRWVCIPVDIPPKYLPQECRHSGPACALMPGRSTVVVFP